MKAQAALEFLYTYGFVIILALVVISLIFHYFSLSLSTAPQCILPYYLRCENFYLNSTHLILNITNNFNYDLNLTQLTLKGKDFTHNESLGVLVERGKTTLIEVEFSRPITTPQFSAQLNFTYVPCPGGECINESYSIIGYLSSPVESG
ncbi:MAG: hypothetical protein GXN92_02245 [Candidatus Micrarchaeota archaeon]|nr:hypothetical protein [Candidatus Micrarchaeota archaeon]